MTVAKKIQKMMKTKEMSYYELSRITGISPSSLQSYGSGRSRKVPYDVIEKLSAAFGVTFDYWLDDDVDDPEKYKTSAFVDREPVSDRDLSQHLADAPVEVASLGRFINEMKELASFYKQGLLTDDEFAAIKKYIMALTLENENH